MPVRGATALRMNRRSIPIKRHSAPLPKSRTKVSHRPVARHTRPRSTAKPIKPSHRHSVKHKPAVARTKPSLSSSSRPSTTSKPAPAGGSAVGSSSAQKAKLKPKVKPKIKSRSKALIKLKPKPRPAAV